ncbi:sugar transferase [Erythrobacter sp.]|uniref:sugar transferase n=1 Tax=Erythrobacter sp. TaxID=1042 RepID=UPI001425D080|nr:sugar transferase [Erythrobacter sp.]QIQ87544.1 MAG: sugar transferase [Erythrobacter sp.]
MYVRVFKPAIDVVLALTASMVLSPLMLAAALAILIEDGRPVFFIHERVGREGRVFKIFKFRSMGKNTAVVPSTDVAQHQVTKVGALIRRLNIDELPQLFNIIQQQMSIVGPRPGLPSQTDLHEARRSNGALALRPGITGQAQINSYDGMSTEAKAVFDGEYARCISFWTDMKIILLTVRYLLKPPPVY